MQPTPAVRSTEYATNLMFELFISVTMYNALDQRPRSKDVRCGTEATPPGSLNPGCSPVWYQQGPFG